MSVSSKKSKLQPAAAWIGPESIPEAVSEACRIVGISLTQLDKPAQLKNGAGPAFDVVILSTPALVTAALTALGPQATAVAMLDHNNPDQGLDAIALGADDVFDTSQSSTELALLLRKTLQRRNAKFDYSDRLHKFDRSFSFEGIVVASQEMRAIFETIEKISEFSTTVLVQGESGTGKELIAKAIHNNSPRAKKPFVAINCGAIPENLLESELFGHRKGAFTDATKDKKGLFEEAEGGTVLLDEIGELPIHLQVKMLRVLQEREIRRVGDAAAIPINVRVIGATLRDLEQDVLDGRFRDDLYYRLNVITIRVPPLRERRDDIPVLVDYFLRRNHEKLGLPVYGIEPSALELLQKHDWPGNIRELENCVERAMILCESTNISIENLPKTVLARQGEKHNLTLSNESLSIKEQVRTLEDLLIRKALERTGGNRTHAAKLLEISHRTLLYKLKEYEISDPE